MSSAFARGVTIAGKRAERWNPGLGGSCHQLDLPLRWAKPRHAELRRDLFHEGLSFEEIAAVFGVMAAAPQHTFQVLTKRPQRALDFFAWLEADRDRLDRAALEHFGDEAECWLHNYVTGWSKPRGIEDGNPGDGTVQRWPLPNVWLGVSVEDQATADERIPLLLQCPAAVRFVSYEPALGPVDFTRVSYLAELRRQLHRFAESQGRSGDEAVAGYVGPAWLDVLNGRWFDGEDGGNDGQRLDWLIVGGESGPGARPFDIGWARWIVRQCHAAGVACFVKQLGGYPFDGDRHGNGSEPIQRQRLIRLQLHDRKGGDWSEWPEDLRVREFPQVRA